MTTRREDIRDAIEDALEDISTANYYDRAGTKKYALTPAEVEYLAQGPDQVDNVDRPYIGFRQAGPISRSYYPGFWLRVTIPWRVYFYPDLTKNGTDLWTQTNAGMDDIRHALHKAFRIEGDLRDCITLLHVDGQDTSEGDLAGERGYVQTEFRTTHWERDDG